MSIKIDRFEVASYNQRYVDSATSKVAIIKDHLTDEIVCEIKLHKTLDANQALAEKIKLIIEEEFED